MGFWNLKYICIMLLIDSTAGVCNICTSYSGFQSIHYQTSEDFIENPGRGFYEHFQTKASQFNPLTVSRLDNTRHVKRIVLALRVYILDSFVNSPLSATFLQQMDTDMEILRSAGWSAILRFSYINTRRSSAPYGDASKNIILQHIQQLSPIWHKFHDVISVIQAGFIGTWGEWYYTTHFGDPEHKDSSGFHGISAQHWNDRKEIVNAMLSAAPYSISVQLRTPAYKQHMFGSTVTDKADVTNHHTKGRIGHFNDCFLRDDTDLGTYSDIAREKAYLARDTKLVPVGGETCGRSTGSSRSDCPTATKELEQFHWCFINSDYHPDVLGDWKKQGCYDDIEKHLGYRISLTKTDFPKTVHQNSELCYRIEIQNTGFAAPYKDWQGLFVLHSKDNGHYYKATMSGIDSRDWLPGQHILQGSIQVSASVPSGHYDMYIAFVESSAVHNVNSYVLMANRNVPDSSNGLNNLHSSIQITAGSSSSTTCPPLKSWSLPTQGIYSRGIHGKTTKGCKTILVPNHSFELNYSSWNVYGNGFEFSNIAIDGQRSIKVTNGGASNIFTFYSPITQLTFSGNSKYVGPVRPATSNYSLYCDIQTVSGSNIWGKNVPFPTGDSAWHQAVLHITVSEGIKQATCYVLYRNHNSGEAYFDKIEMRGCNN